jgi:phosphoribosylanthranilate isomerase
MVRRPRLKICGVTSAADARLVTECGADYCGILVDVGFSERSLALPEAREVAAASGVPVIVLVCDAPMSTVEAIVREISPYAVQLLGHEAPEFAGLLKARFGCRIWKTLHQPPSPGQAPAEEYVSAGVDAFLIDRSDTSEGFLRLGGTGKVADWGQAAAMIGRIPKPVFLAGGIHANNVAAALFQVRPYGIDLCSGVEASKGKKDPEKMRRLAEAFKAAVKGIEESEE